MKCIICEKEKKPSEEHIFPESIGGSLKINNICTDCNNKIGRTIDCNLSDSFIVLMMMYLLKIKGKNKKIKTDFYNKALISEDGNKYEYVFNENGDRVKIKHPFRCDEKEVEDGKKTI